jgi:hypothetical protein
MQKGRSGERCGLETHPRESGVRQKRFFARGKRVKAKIRASVLIQSEPIAL